MTMTIRNKLPGNRDGDEQKPEHASKDDSPSQVKNSHIIAEMIDVGVAPKTAYDQWLQYDKWSEMFKRESAQRPRGRKSAGEQGAGDRQVTVNSKIGPSQRHWDVEVVQRDPGRRVAWRAKGGIQARGVTTFHRLDDRLTQLMVDIEYRPTGFLETLGNFLRMPRRRVRKDLKLFKHYIELKGEATGQGAGARDESGDWRQELDERVEESR